MVEVKVKIRCEEIDFCDCQEMSEILVFEAIGGSHYFCVVSLRLPVGETNYSLSSPLNGSADEYSCSDRMYLEADKCAMNEITSEDEESD